MEDEDPLPPPILRPPPALPDEIVEEIVLRSPPDDPAHLVRAALVCKRWARLVSARAFRRRFGDFHLQRGGAPMLGFFIHRRGGPSTPPSADFVRTSASCPWLHVPWRWLVLDARGGRVLLHRTERPGSLVFRAGQLVYERNDLASAGIRLAVWDPLSAAGGGHLELPVPALPRRPPCWNAVLLRCDRNGLQDDAGGSFRVVLVGLDHNWTFACVYSSLGPAAWSEPIYTGQHPDPGGVYVEMVRSSALVRNAFYFLFKGRTSILKYDLATGDMSVIVLPPASHSGSMSRAVLTTTEEGCLGFAGLEGSKLCLWSMEPRPNDGALTMEWTQGRVIDLTSLLPGTDPDIDSLGFADGAGMILVGTIDSFFSVDQKSGRIDKLVDNPNDDLDYCYTGGIVPYLSFYTPALGMTSTDEGASVNA